MGYAAKLGGKSSGGGSGDSIFYDLMTSPIPNAHAPYMYLIPTGGNAELYTAIADVSDIQNIHYRFIGSGNIYFYTCTDPTNASTSNNFLVVNARYPNICEANVDISGYNYLNIRFSGLGGAKTLHIEQFYFE